MITRRCSERRFFLRPDPQTNNAFLYCLALAADVYRVQVMFTATMSNHHRSGIIDGHGPLPEFLAYSALRKVYPGCGLSFTYCSTAGGRGIGTDDVSATLSITCTEA